MKHEPFIVGPCRAMFYNDAVVSAFVAGLLDVEPGAWSGSKAIGFCDDEGLLEAGVIYSGWNPKSRIMEITAAARHRRWGTLARLKLIMAYPFEVCGCRFLVARTSATNEKPLRIWRTLGAKEYRIDDLRGDGEDEIVTTLSAKQWFGSKFYG